MLQKLKLFRGPTKRVRKREAPPGLMAFLEKSRLVAALIFLATVASIVLISFVGVTMSNLPVLPNQAASVRLAASVAFAYESDEQTRQLREQIRDRVPPVFRLEFQPLRQFETHLARLLADLAAHAATHSATALDPAAVAARRESFATLVTAFNAAGPYRAATDDVAALLRLGDAERRFGIVENTLVVLREIYAQGVHDNPTLSAGPGTGDITVFQIASPEDEVRTQNVQSLEDALTLLRINLAAEGIGRETTVALFRLFRNGVTPNLTYDNDATRRQQELALANLRPVVVQVERGETIIEPGTRVTGEQYEKLVAQRQYLLATGGVAANEGLQLFGRTLLVLAMVMASVFYIRLEDRETFLSNSRLGLLALVVILNLAAVRTTYAMGGLPYFITNSTAAAFLPYLAPTALAPLVVAILINAGSAVFMALLISIFTAVIYGNRLDLLVITFLASMIAISAVQHTRKRATIVRGTLFAGASVAIFTLLIGIIDQLPAFTILKQMTAGLLTGLLTGVVVIGLLPLLESLFKRTTDITLLELTDYNHPLLRRLQLEAPGTYHHSLVVAQLAENAANAIGANALRARVCCLFHDVGKMVKPQYFAENQQEGVNPHDFNNPSLSALIIKSHVKEGVDLALQHRLPRVIINVIRQHHGTTLIRYFFHRALNRDKPRVNPVTSTSLPLPPPAASKDPGLPGLEPVPVSEATYRYDGPRPQFKESAIILLADSCEAASRSLAKFSPQNLEELINKIVQTHIEDGQLDECPLTFAEITKIKHSFNFTLLNMLHSRVAYPPAPSAA